MGRGLSCMKEIKEIYDERKEKNFVGKEDEEKSIKIGIGKIEK